MTGLMIAPQMASRNFDRTADFYRPFGFAEVARYAEGYLILRRETAELHFNQVDAEYDPATSRQSAYARFPSVAALTGAFEPIDLPEAGLPRFVPAEAKPWGMVEAHSVDDDGNLVYYGAEMDPTG